MSRGVAIVGAGVLSPLGSDWRGLGELVERGATLESHYAEIPPPTTAAEKRARRLMSRAAALSDVAIRSAIDDAGWQASTESLGMFMGVGASGGDLDQVEAMVGKSQVDGALSMEAFGRAGLRACNPLYAFQLMNNFTMCHAAILAGTRGPNDVFFSRGFGTLMALAEAADALRKGRCERALAGGADTAIDRVTEIELYQGGFIGAGLVASEGAAAVALSSAEPGLATLTGVHYQLTDDCFRNNDVVVTAAWGPRPQQTLAARSSGRVLDVGANLGESLAATQAIAWLVALDEITSGRARRALIACHGIDDQACGVTLEAPR